MRETAGGGVLRWGARVAVVLVLTIASAEATLRLGALVLQATGRERPESWLTDSIRVLCLGDSNTYGLLVEPEQAWPKVFERLWNQDPSRPPIEVINLGFPGMNSSRILRDLPRLLRVFQPDLVLVMVGANDYWTVPVTVDSGANESLSQRIAGALWRWSRLYRLIHIASGAFADRDLELGPVDFKTFAHGSRTVRQGREEFELGWVKRPGPRSDADSKALAQNLRAIAGTITEAGTRLVLVTYPSEGIYYDDADALMRDAAAATGTPLVDLGARFRPLCPDSKCDLLFPDEHPTVSGHALAAETLVEQLGAAGISP